MSGGKPGKRRSIEAAIAAVLFLLLGLGVVWFAKAVAGITSSTILAVLAIMPALLFVILRGDLAELRGPGGWAATFRVTTATVTFAVQKFDMATTAQVIQKGSLSELDGLASQFDRNQPVVMTVTMNKNYEVDAMERYLRALIGWPRFKLVAFLDDSGKFVGCASANGFYSLIQNYQLAYEFLQIVQAGNELGIFQYPGILKNVINTDATNADALAAMDQYALGALAVVGEDRHVKGIVEREQLMSKMILSLVKDATGNCQLFGNMVFHRYDAGRTISYPHEQAFAGVQMNARSANSARASNGSVMHRMPPIAAVRALIPRRAPTGGAHALCARRPHRRDFVRYHQ